MFAKTSVSMNTTLDKDQIKSCTKKLLDEFCIKYPEIKGKKRDQVKDIYHYSVKFDVENIPTDAQILNDINNITSTSIHTYEYKYLRMNKNGKINVYWKETEELLHNISLSKFNNIKEFRSVFKGKVEEKLLNEYWEKEKNEFERVNFNIKEIIKDLEKNKESSDKEYEEIVIPKMRKN